MPRGGPIGARGFRPAIPTSRSDDQAKRDNPYARYFFHARNSARKLIRVIGNVQAGSARRTGSSQCNHCCIRSRSLGQSPPSRICRKES